MGQPQSAPTLYRWNKNSWKVSPMAVSGMANSVLSVATRNLPCTDRPTPCRHVGGGIKVRKQMRKRACLSPLQSRRWCVKMLNVCVCVTGQMKKNLFYEMKVLFIYFSPRLQFLFIKSEAEVTVATLKEFFKPTSTTFSALAESKPDKC